MTDLEAASVIQEFHKKKSISGDDVDMSDDAEAQPGLGSTTHPGERQMQKSLKMTLLMPPESPKDLENNSSWMRWETSLPSPSP